MSLNLLKQQLREAKIINKGDYRYIINTITEQEPALEPAILDDCANKLLQRLNHKGTTKILTPEVMGIPIATVISLKASIPLIIATRRKKEVLNEVSVNYICGYENGYFYVNGINKNDKVLIIDDLISTSGTVLSMINAVKKVGAGITDIGVIFNKVDYQGMWELEKLGFQPKTLLNIKLNGSEVDVKDFS